MVTEDMGVIGLSLSVGIICDGPVQLPDTRSSVLTKGKDVFWPAEPYHDFRGLPELWMGALRTTNDATRLRTVPVIPEQTLRPQSHKPASLPSSPSQKSTTSTYTDGFDSDGAGNADTVVTTQATVVGLPDEDTPPVPESPLLPEPSIPCFDSLLDVAEATLFHPVAEFDGTWQSAVSGS